MKEKKRLGHDDRINLQAAIAKGLALLLQRMPRIAALQRQEAILRLRRPERPPHEEPARPEDLQGHLRRGRRQNRLRRLRRRGEGASLHHIFESDASLKAICCERTVRRYVYAGYLSVKARQLPRYVRFSHKYGYSERKTAMYAKKAGAKVIKFHEFLLSCVSNLLASGLSVRVVAHWVGDTERTVQDTYSHLLPSDKDVIKDFFEVMSSSATTNPLPDGD